MRPLEGRGNAAPRRMAIRAYRAIHMPDKTRLKDQLDEQRLLKERESRGQSFFMFLIKPTFLAGELGFEPRLTESESAVLPLDDSPL